MKRWEDALQLAEEFVTFLERDIFFDKPFINTVDALVVTNPKIGWEYANGQKYDQLFPEWEDISMGEDSFPDDFKYFDSIYYGLQKNNYFDIEQKNFSGINELWDNNIADMMIGDMIYIFNCYANDHFPPLWNDILTAYLKNGLPCGWSDFLPHGRLVVFSNE